MRRRREDWILDGLNGFAVAACDDPAEQLARVAVGHGELAVWQVKDAEMMGREVHEFLIMWHARNAWRFALAALDLCDLYDVMDGARLIFESTKARAGAMDDASTNSDDTNRGAGR